ncbi:phosphoadenylyl-sulfate reductase [Flavisolibacter ginsenosidimutans]|uniref:Adenosine 5'-phosphosulfate reductase n=1 Tax=Flavisolibacter ginsenosidimutans TaxID=661481 RepID=A0A5B8UGW7_9BACT|nr:phosphoadenylyl-sulfate reductase [Flavisolibacter ginsenosidimutans]QEC55901.1 phosphoadenylyl-sulfate reductase [Flavisolibacter ginsenosidimutans]
MSIQLKDSFLSLQQYISGLSINEALEKLNEAFPEQLVFSTSFSYEDQVITDYISETAIPVSIFTLDTGRLFPETYSTWSRTLERYQLTIDAYYPQTEKLQEFVREYGPNSFYESVENRKSCCHIRKVEPLKRALAGKAVWITGLRAEHSPNRSDMQILEWDEANQIIKYNPLLHWATEEVRQYIDQRNVPYNALHDRGFVSIGCAPCTRAIKPGEDFRAGRWWWEDASKKECGLHVHQTATT